MKRRCPECQTPVPLRERIRLEFLGGDIACACGARLLISHTWAWIVGAAVLSDLVVFLLIVLTVAGGVAWLGWWSLVVGAALFVALGVVVAALSPLTVRL